MSSRRRSERLESLRRSYQTRSKTSAVASVSHGSTKRAAEQSSQERPKRAVRKEAGDKLQGDHPQTLTPNSKESTAESSPNSHPRGELKEGQPRKGITKVEIERKYLMLRQKYWWRNMYTLQEDEDEEDDLEVFEEDDGLGNCKENVEKDKQGDEVMHEGQQPEIQPEEEKVMDEGQHPNSMPEEEKLKDEPQQPESVPEEHSGTADTKSAKPEQQQADDGSRRCTLQDPLKYFVAEVMEGIDDIEDELLNHGRNRKRKDTSSAARKGRGLAIPREEATFQDRPGLIVVGDGEFTSKPICSKIVTTIRLLTLWNLPGPYRTYKAFPFDTRLSIARQFLRRYRWEEGQNLERCLEVFEFIADGVYCRELTDVRRNMKKKLGNNAVAWEERPPAWCRNNEYWKGLCQIWATDKWIEQSTRNHVNRTKNGRIVYHVGGAKSTYKHKQALVNYY